MNGYDNMMTMSDRQFINSGLGTKAYDQLTFGATPFAKSMYGQPDTSNYVPLTLSEATGVNTDNPAAIGATSAGAGTN